MARGEDTDRNAVSNLQEGMLALSSRLRTITQTMHGHIDAIIGAGEVEVNDVKASGPVPAPRSRNLRNLLGQLHEDVTQLEAALTRLS